MRHAVTSFVSLAVLSLLAGCPDRSISELDPVQGRVEYKDIPITPNRNVDILFVVDDSPSMADKQANLARNFPEFIRVLDSIQGGRPSVHIGVVTSDMGTRGSNGTIAPGVGMIGKGGCMGTGDAGNLQTNGAPVSGGPFISDIVQMDGNRTTNYTGNLADVFSTMAKVGDGGCGFEQHLEAAKAALNNNPANAGFLRDEAYLAVIFIADEDDCTPEDAMALLDGSATAIATLGAVQSFRCTRFGVTCDQGGRTANEMNQVGPKSQCHPNDSLQYLAKVRDYPAFFKGLKSNPNKVIVAGIMGTTDPFAVELRVPSSGGTAIPALAHSCSYTHEEAGRTITEVADPSTRLRFFLDQFPNRSTFAPICQQDLSGGLQQIGDLLKTVIGNPCIEGKLADGDPSTPRVDAECSVSTVIDTGSGFTNEEILPQCTPDAGAPSNAPCWRLVPDQTKCPETTTHLILTIEQSTTKPFDLDTHVIANCVTEA